MGEQRSFGHSSAAQYIILLIVMGVLLGFVNIIPSLLNATYNTHKLISDMSVAYYKYKAAVNDEESSTTLLRERKTELTTSLEDLRENRFYSQMAENDSRIRKALELLSTATRRYTSTGSDSAAAMLEEELDSFSVYIGEYTKNQKFTLTVSLIAALFTLMVMVLLIFYLYRKNRRIVGDLRKALEDREYLLMEIHHRIKNNLAMISSLISIKSRELTDDSPMRDLRQQVSTIGMVHELLYQGEDVSAVELGEYFDRLLRNVFYSLSSEPVQIEIETEGLRLNPKKVVPLGLIITEMATNAVKHGFHEEGERRFSLEARWIEAEQRYEFKISNSGRPFPEDRSPENGGSMGIELIHSLVRQLRGSIDLYRNPLTTFILRFPE
jgi:two-component sensor histidine kinase